MADPGAAQQRWELENEVAQPQPDAVADSYYHYDLAEQQQLQREKPWSKDPHYFKQVHISALALLKMAMHAKSGGNIEVMGMLQGKVIGREFVVVDAFALPVEGTETRVNAQTEAYEYMVDFAETTKLSGRLENMVGWYHSHPGYGCWLSGIDCQTQMTQQLFQEPFLALVIDPHRTIAAGKVELGAFRTYPENYKPPDEPASEYQTIPLEKIEDFGVHCKSYYALEVDYFKSSLDAALLDTLWNKYWVNTLAASPLLATRALGTGQLTDIAAKMAASDQQLATTGRAARFAGALDKKASAGEAQLQKVCRDAAKFAVEQVKGLSCQVVKDLVFNRPMLPSACATHAPVAAAGGPNGVSPMEET